jgi:pSer/pThr/pTyr-binding forkhead associated (FHA) protein
MSRGTPTGKWETIPPHLGPDGPVDVRKAQPKLTVRRPGVPAVDIPIEKTEFVIGRHAAEVDLVLDDDWVSRRHAKLTMDERGYFRLDDMGSQNGIKYHGRPVRRLNLVDGDKFFIGKTELVFRAVMNRPTAPPDAPLNKPKAAPRGGSSRIQIPEPGPPKFADPAEPSGSDE